MLQTKTKYKIHSSFSHLLGLLRYLIYSYLYAKVAKNVDFGINGINLTLSFSTFKVLD